MVYLLPIPYRTYLHSATDAYRKGSAIRNRLNCSVTASKQRGYVSTRGCLRDAPVEAVMEAQMTLTAETVQVGEKRIGQCRSRRAS